MRVFPKAIVFTTKSHFDVKRTCASIRGLVVRTIGLGKTRISAITMPEKVIMLQRFKNTCFPCMLINEPYHSAAFLRLRRSHDLDRQRQIQT